MARRLWRTVQWVAGLLILAGVTRSVVRNWHDLRLAEIPWRLSWLPLVASILVVWCGFAALALAWRTLIDGRPRPAPSVIEAGRIWLFSSMAKYIPGKVWTFAGMAVLARRAGVSPWIAAEAALVLQVLAIGTGVAALSLSGILLEQTVAVGTSTLWIVFGLSAAGLALLLWPPVAARLEAMAMRVLPASGNGDRGGNAGAPPSPARAATRPPSAAALGIGIVANAVAWAGYGLALWLIAQGTMPVTDLALSTAVGGWTASYLLGFLSPMPGGLGVREGVLFVLLRPELGAAAAAGLAAASRLIFTISEVGAVIPFLLRPREVPGHGP